MLLKEEKSKVIAEYASLSPWTIENGWSKKKSTKLCHEKGY